MSEFTMVSITHILKTVMESVDFGMVSEYDYHSDADEDCRTHFWREVINSKASDSGFPHLVDSMLAHGGFTEGSAIGWSEDAKMITEGHHRLVAAILLGLDEVPTRRYGADDHLGISAHDYYANEPSPYSNLV